MQQGEVIPAEELQLGLASHLSGTDGQLGTGQVEEQVAVEAHTISEEHVVEVEVLLNADGRLLVLQAVHCGKHWLHQPQHLATVHDVLVNEELVFLVERFGGLCDDDGIV